MSDWIEEFLSLTETVRSPQSFRLWTAIQTIACAMERKVWTETDQDPLYPNMYTILAGGPASGKTLMVSTCRRLLTELIKPDGIHLAPDNPTKASFLDSLAKSVKPSINGMGINMYSAMSVLCMELGVLISKYEKDFVADLTTLYDGPPFYSAPRRTSTSVAIEAPILNILAAATPDALGDILPESAWGQGFTSRIIFVYGTSPNFYREIFQKRKEKDMSNLKKQLKIFYEELHGEFDWEDDAQDAMKTWFNEEKMAPVPTYGRLVNYCGRRDVHVMKLAMISAISAGNGLTVTLSDFHRAQKWLFETEETMPDVFRAMAQKSDAQLLQDAHRHLWIKYSNINRDKRKPMPEREIWTWFENKVPHEKVSGLIIALERTGRIKPGMLPGTWVPNPLTDISPD